MGLVIAGTLSDYRDAERAPTDVAGGLYAILREAESVHAVWGARNLPFLRERLRLQPAAEAGRRRRRPV